jgi:FAD-binding domain/Ferric reductase NAD binding domain
MSALHHPPLWWWCWLALLLWAGERIWRATSWLYLNGFLGSRFKISIPRMTLANQKLPTHSQGWELHSVFPDVEPNFAANNPLSLSRTSYFASSKPSIYHHARLSSTHSLLPTISSTFSIPVGYAHAEILAGRTIRLRIVTPGRLTWAPGQHFLICIPFLSKFVSHPFTVASVCDKQKLGDDGRTIVLLIRAKNGWTKDLWTTVVGHLAHGRRHPPGEVPEGTTLPTTGILLKAWVDGPFGSPVRTNWSGYSTAVIVSGGSGASFAISVLEYLCLCMAGRDGRSLGGTMGRRDSFSMRRIRFIWILRDFGELLSVRVLLEERFINHVRTQLICNGVRAFYIGVNCLFHQSRYSLTYL